MKAKEKQIKKYIIGIILLVFLGAFLINLEKHEKYTYASNWQENNIDASSIDNEDIKITSKRNILTSSLVATYPFISSAIFDENGIFVGTNIYDNSLVFIDRFEKEKYKNANICIFGTSGARKIILY